MKQKEKFEMLEKKYNIKYFLKDTVLLSYPKSGRTWLRMILAKILDLKGYSTQEYEMIPAVHLPIDEIKKQFGTDINVIFLYRNIGDVVLSYYNEKTTSTRSGTLYEGSVKDFINDSEYGASKIAEYNSKCYNSLGLFKKSKVITYEKMISDTYSVVKGLTSFMGIEVSDEEINKAVEYSNFQNMQKIEQGKGKNHLSNYKGNFGKSVGRVRQGKVDAYKDTLKDMPVLLNYIELMQSKQKYAFSLIDEQTNK